MRIIEIAAALLTRPDGRVLVVRKRGTEAFMQPGGKIEAGETAVAALLRELGEEIGLRFAEPELRHMGRFSAVAANEEGAMVEAEVFAVDGPSEIAIAAEITEARWIDPKAPGDMVLAPLTRDHILPAWNNRAKETAS